MHIALGSDEKCQKSWVCLQEIFPSLWFYHRARGGKLSRAPNSGMRRCNWHWNRKVMYRSKNTSCFKQMNVVLFESSPTDCELHPVEYQSYWSLAVVCSFKGKNLHKMNRLASLIFSGGPTDVAADVIAIYPRSINCADFKLHQNSLITPFLLITQFMTL